jgi:hypothetical protein
VTPFAFPSPDRRGKVTRQGRERAAPTGTKRRKWRKTLRHSFFHTAAEPSVTVIARSEATWQSMQRFSFLERLSKQKGCLDCNVASLLAMTSVIRYALSFVNLF